MSRASRPKVVLTCAWLLAFAAYCPVLCIPAMVPLLREAMHVSHAAVGFLFSVPLAMLVVMAVPGGLLGDRVGVRWAVALSAVLMAAGSMLRGLAFSFGWLLAFTVVYGLGYSVLMPNLPKLVGTWFPRERVGLATGVYATGITVGATLPLAVTLPFVYPIFGTVQGTLFLWGLPAAGAALLWLFLAKDPPAPAGPAPAADKRRGGNVLPLLRNGNMWAVAAMLFLNNVHFYTWSAWTPSLLVMKGGTPDWAAFIASSRGWASLPTMFLMPWASYRLGVRKPFMWGSALLLVIASIGAVYMTVPMGWVLMAVVGVATSGTFSMILALPLEMLPPESAGMASGAILSLGYLGALVGPWLAGRILDTTGSLDADLVILAVAGVLWAVVGAAVPETGRRGAKSGGKGVKAAG